MMRRAIQSEQGFTLLEVMVAIAILGLGLTAILSAQAGAFASTSQARSISIGAGLLRCKMTELEQHLFEDGFQEGDENDNGPCCNDEDVPGFRCSWRIEKPELPEPKYGQLDLNADLNLASPSGSGSPGGLDLLSQLSQGKGGLPDNARPGDIAEKLGGGAESGLPDTSAIAGMAMEMVYPQLKTIFDMSCRRITVSVNWNEGDRPQSIEIAQWVTSAGPAGLAAANAADAANRAADDLSGTSSGGTSSGGTSSGGTRR